MELSEKETLKYCVCGLYDLIIPESGPKKESSWKCLEIEVLRNFSGLVGGRMRGRCARILTFLYLRKRVVKFVKSKDLEVILM